MRRRVLALTLALAVVILLAPPVQAARPRPAFWHPAAGPSWGPSNEVVEQQSVFPRPDLRKSSSVINPDYALEAGCSFDVDDQRWRGLSGDYLDAGATVSGILCLYADWAEHLVALSVNQAGLRATLALPGHVTLTVAGPGRACVVGPRYSFTQRGTTAGPAYDDSWIISPLLTDEIPGSNGGLAVTTTLTYSITNTTGKRIRFSNTASEIRMVYAGFSFVAVPTGCPYPWFEHFTKLYPTPADPQVWYWTGGDL